MNSYKYPDVVTEVFDGANFHINYCLGFIKKYLFGDILEIGAGCGSFTKYYFNKLIFKKETYPSKTKIFIWDKFFTPISFVVDFMLNYKFGKAILAIYKKD